MSTWNGEGVKNNPLEEEAFCSGFSGRKQAEAETLGIIGQVLVTHFKVGT